MFFYFDIDKILLYTYKISTAPTIGVQRRCMRPIFVFRLGGRRCEILAFDENAQRKALWTTQEFERFGSDAKASMNTCHAEAVLRYWTEIPLAKRTNVTFLFPYAEIGKGDKTYIRFDGDGMPRKFRAHVNSSWMAKDCFLIRFSV